MKDLSDTNVEADLNELAAQFLQQLEEAYSNKNNGRLIAYYDALVALQTQAVDFGFRIACLEGVNLDKYLVYK